MTDVRLYELDGDDGEIDYRNGQAVMSDGLETAVYLSLFGGNDEDSGLQDTDSKQWWFNFLETVAERRHRSETQFLLHSLPAIPANLRRLEEAVEADLAWMSETKLATFLGALASMPGVNKVTIAIRIEMDGQVFPFEFTEPWRTA